MKNEHFHFGSAFQVEPRTELNESPLLVDSTAAIRAETFEHWQADTHVTNPESPFTVSVAAAVGEVSGIVGIIA
jgi:hypothetical protein